MTKRQEAAELTRRSIVEAAERLVLEKGLDAINIEDITREAGVSKGSFYTYFPSKEDVLDEITYRRFNDIYDISMGPSSSVHGSLCMFLEGSMRYIVESGIHLCQSWVSSASSSDDRWVNRKLRYDHEKISEILSKDEDDPDVVWIVRVYYGIVFTWAITNGSSDPIKEIGDFCRGPLKVYLEGSCPEGR